jgi:hypothetical protein
MAARNGIVFQLQIVGGVPADTILALRQRNYVTLQRPAYG